MDGQNWYPLLGVVADLQPSKREWGVTISELMLTGQTAAPRRPSTFLYSKVPPPNHHLQCRFPRPALWSITPICMSCLVYPWLSMQVSFLLVHFVCRCLGRRRAPRYRRHELKGSNWRQVPRRQGQARPPRVTWKRSELGAVTTSDWTLVSLGLGSGVPGLGHHWYT